MKGVSPEMITSRKGLAPVKSSGSDGLTRLPEASTPQTTVMGRSKDTCTVKLVAVLAANTTMPTGGGGEYVKLHSTLSYES